MKNVLLYKILRKMKHIADYLWDFFHPVVFLHSTDLMLPYSPDFLMNKKDGVTTLQLKIISFIYDIEIFESNNDFPAYENETFRKFVKSIDFNGFDYNHSFIQLYNKPFLRIQEGSHRMSYLLYKNNNCFIPIKIMPPWTRSWFPIEGYNYRCEAELVPQNIIENHINKYVSILNQMRKEITCIVKKSVWEQYSESLLKILNKNGKVFIKGEQKIYYFNEFKKATGIKVKENEKCIVLYLSIDWNRLKYSNYSKLKSERLKVVANEIKEIAGKNWGYIGESITESVYLDSIIDMNSANKKNRV